MALGRKWPALMALRPDVAIVPECARPDVKPPWRHDGDASRSMRWTGHNPNKGLGVFTFGDWTLDVEGGPVDDAEHFLNLTVRGPAEIDLLAVWSVYKPEDRIKAQRGATHRALDATVARSGRRPLIVAGDFNHHLRWDRPGHASNHAGLVDRLADLGLKSAFHAARGVEQGGETEPTLYWKLRNKDGPSYHVDYIFIPSELSRASFRLDVGGYADWAGAGLSDHVPLVLNVEDQALRALR